MRSPCLYNDHEGAILNWLEMHYDDSTSEPTPVPEAWWRFQFIANELIRNDSTEVHCLKCKAHYSTDQLILKNDRGRSGWNFDRVVCPKDHLLLISETILRTLFIKRYAMRKNSDNSGI